MRNKTAFFLFLLFFVLNVPRVYAGVEYYYTKINRNGKTLELGKEDNQGHTTQKIRFSANEDPAAIAQKLAPTGLFQKRLWVYFHCMWGNNSVFHRMTLHYISQVVDNGQDNILLSVIWPANKMGYKQNWKKVTAKGQRLGNLFTCMTRQQKAPINVLSHSMGNRVFQGVWQTAGAELKLENVILASPDLDTDIFENDFKNLSQQSTRIVVVQHHNDRLLLASSVVLGKERLGRTRHISPAPANMQIIDATPYKSLRGMEMSNHLHFIFADSVRHQLKKMVH